MMRTRSARLFGWTCLLALGCLAGCSGGTSYENKADPGAESGPTVVHTGGQPLEVAVMPVSFQVNPAETDPILVARGNDMDFRTWLWTTLKQRIDSSSRFKRVALPSAAARDEIVQKTMRYAAGLMPAEEFAKVKSFELPDRYVYGALNAEVMVEKQMRGPDKKTYVAGFTLNLVDNTSNPRLAKGTGRASSFNAAVRQAIDSALAKVRVQ